MTILTVTEHRQEELRDVSFELLQAGNQLAEAGKTEHHTTVISDSAADHAEKLNLRGVDVVHPVTCGHEFNHDVYLQILEEVVDVVAPTVIVMPHTADGMDYAPALASRLDRPLVTDCVAMSYTKNLTVTRDWFSSKIETEISVDAATAAVTIRPGAWSTATGPGNADIEPIEVDVDGERVATETLGFEEITGGDIAIVEDDVVVGVGGGLESEADLDAVFDLAEAMDATVAATRPLVDAGWMPVDRQVGQSGYAITPDVYLAIGISGDPRHVSGIRGADTVFAINKDPDAPIFGVADYGVVGDLYEIVPELLAVFE